MKQTELKKFYFTFGCGQDNAGYCQPIYAKDYKMARKRMFDIHGAKWSFQYTEEQWEENKARALQCFYPIEKEMTPIYCKEGAENASITGLKRKQECTGSSEDEYNTVRNSKGE